MRLQANYLEPLNRNKLKSKIKVDSNATDETLQEKALADKKIESLLGLNDPKKIIVISGKLVNIVL